MPHKELTVMFLDIQFIPESNGTKEERPIEIAYMFDKLIWENLTLSWRYENAKNRFIYRYFINAGKPQTRYFSNYIKQKYAHHFWTFVKNVSYSNQYGFFTDDKESVEVNGTRYNYNGPQTLFAKKLPEFLSAELKTVDIVILRGKQKLIYLTEKINFCAEDIFTCLEKFPEEISYCSGHSIDAFNQSSKRRSVCSLYNVIHLYRNRDNIPLGQLPIDLETRLSITNSQTLNEFRTSLHPQHPSFKKVELEIKEMEASSKTERPSFATLVNSWPDETEEILMKEPEESKVNTKLDSLHPVRPPTNNSWSSEMSREPSNLDDLDYEFEEYCNADIFIDSPGMEV